MTPTTPTTPFSVCKHFCAGSGGNGGTTFIPYVSPEGVISWTNDGGFANPEPVNIKGDTPIKGVDYYTEAEKAAVIDDVCDVVCPAPITTIPTTLTPSQQYNFGEVTELALAFPTVANDGDVIYATFMTGETATALTIDTTNTCDIEFVPEPHTGYEVFGKFNGLIWIVNYSEYTVSEG